MSHKLPWFKFNAVHWLRDRNLQRCSLAARGLWIDMLALMHDASEPYGHMRDIDGPFSEEDQMREFSISRADLRKSTAELSGNRVFSRGEDGVIFSRRMVRDAGASQASDVASDAASTAASTPASSNGSGSASNGTSPHAGARAHHLTSSSDADVVLKTTKNHKPSELTDQQFLWFGMFWAEYWRRVSRPAAEKSFARLITSQEVFDVAMQGLRQQSASMLGRDPEHRPHASTWLNNKRWEDEIPVFAGEKRATRMPDLE